MILLSLGHSIMHATMINWIQYMGDMGVISKIGGKYPTLGDLKKKLWPLDPIYDTIFYSATL